MTQEQLAQRLGVSTPAVNKWENDNSYPDITLLPPIARVLGIDLDTLFGFHEQLSMQEIAQWTEHLQRLGEQEGIAAAHTAAVERIRQYPNCGSLLLQSASILTGLNMVYGTQPNPYQSECMEWIERAAKIPETAETATAMLIGQYRQMKMYDRAQELLDTLPEQHMDKRHLQASIYLDCGELQKAYEVLESHLLSATTELLMILGSLMTAAQQEKDETAQQRYAELYEQISHSLQPLGGWLNAQMKLAYAMERRDREDSLRCLRELLECIGCKPNEEILYLYRHTRIKDTSSLTDRSILLQILKNAPEAEFLRDDPEFLALLEQADV